MSNRSAFPVMTMLALIAIMSLFTMATASADEEATADDQKATANDGQTDAEASSEDDAETEKVDIYAVPDGSIEDLLAFIDQLQAFRPTSLEQYLAHRTKSPEALQAAAEKILELENDKTSDAYRKAAYVILLNKAGKVADMEADGQRALVKEICSCLANKEVERDDVNLAMTVARGLEYSGATELAADAYNELGSIFSRSNEPSLVNYGDMFTGSARRLQLIGNALELQGTKMAGEKFDIAELKGRVVLVDFWATWCGPCRAEQPNIKENYEKYHDRGFEVVGVSIDQNREPLEKYLEEQKVPWLTLHESDNGGKNAATQRYGIMGIPTMFLVGRDGNVISTKARGAELTRLLVEQFGDAAADDEGEATNEQ